MAVIEVEVQLTIGGNSYTPRKVEVNHSYDQPASTFVLELGDDASAINLNDTVVLAMGDAGDVGQVIEGGYVDSIEQVRPPGTYIVRGRDKLKLALMYLLVPPAAGEPAKSYSVGAGRTDSSMVTDLLTTAGIDAGDITATNVFTFTQPNNVDADTIEFSGKQTAWDAIQQICRAARGRCWVRHNGTVRYDKMLPRPEDATQNVGTLDNTNTLSLRWTKTDRGLYNKIIVVGADSSVQGEASASSPYLPSGFYKTAYWDFGTDFVFTQAEADTIASDILADINKQEEWIDAVVIGNYRHRVEFSLYVTDPWMGLNNDEFFIYSARKTYSAQSGFQSNLRLHRWVT